MIKSKIAACFIAVVVLFGFCENPGIYAESSSVLSTNTLIPCGFSVGITLSTDGVLVSELSADSTAPSQKAGLKPGDIIRKCGDKKITSVQDLNNAISKSNGKETALTIIRNGKKIETFIIPKKEKANADYKIGAWVKDAASGIGTLTFYDPKTKTFAALGHGICDPETGDIISATDGEIMNATIVSVNKGEKGIPGELNGVISEESTVIGKITKNTPCGVFGKISDEFSCDNTEKEIGTRQTTKTGTAYILSNIEGKKTEKFDIEIKKVLPKSDSFQKGMVIEITDKKLIEKTGGIVQGMSGSPIIQDGKIVGAVTHVFVNSPTRGYGIFVEDMLSNAK